MDGSETPVKLLVLGLDCVPPFILEEWTDRLPNLRALKQQSLHGRLRSTNPPITIPAWMVACTGQNPGRIGFFGFRNRVRGTYDQFRLVNSTLVKATPVWDLASQAGKQVGVIGVPPGYPPTPVNGFRIGCFLTPSIEADYTYPAELKREIAETVGEYIIDAEGYRTEDKAPLLERIFTMTERRFALLRHFMTTKPWDFLMVVEMGPDRLHHGFWRYFDPAHPKFEKGTPFDDAFDRYYRFLDDELGKTLALVDDDTAVIVMSDHGAKAMRGSINVNEWLIQHGYLTLKQRPANAARLKAEMVDWSRTRAWGWGGYHARIFFNVQGREPQGIVAPGDFDALRSELAGKLKALPGSDGAPMHTRTYIPGDIYSGPYTEDAPDLTVYFDDLSYRATEEVGLDGIYSFETELGPDEAVHDYEGIFLLRAPGVTPGHQAGMELRHVAPTMLKLLGLPVPPACEREPLG